MIKTRLYSFIRPYVSVSNVDSHCEQLLHHPDLKSLSADFLERLISYVRDNNRYYQATKATKLTEFPALTKAIIREHYRELQSPLAGVKTYENSSGGSTGKPQTFVQDMHFSAWSEAAQLYYYRHFLGINPVEVKKVVLWGSERDTFRERDIKGQVANWLTNTVFLNTFRATEADWLRYIDTINRVKPYFVKGYAGSLYEIARVSKKHNKPIYHPVFVYSSAEMLQDFMRKEIEEAFGAKVYDYYGSREVGAIAGECSKGKKHIFTFHNYIEILDDNNQPVERGRPGKVVVTNLHNYSMPLIRYEIGDYGALGSGACACGSTLPWFKELKGRITDHFIAMNGELIHGEYFTHLFYFRDWVESFQVNQTDHNRVEVLVVRSGKENKADVADITDKIRFVMGASCDVAWKFVSDIPKTAQGKHLFTRCLVKR